MHKRGNWEGANPATWFPRNDGSNECQICKRKMNIDDLRIVHNIRGQDINGEDHLDVCKMCFHHAPELEGWHACGCGG